MDGFQARGERTKNQIPNTKEIPNSKLQTAARASSLELLWCFLFGVLSFNWRRDFPSPHSFVAGRGRRNTVEAALVILSSYLRTKKLRRRDASELWEPVTLLSVGDVVRARACSRVSGRPRYTSQARWRR